jgi:hypothetical protein
MVTHQKFVLHVVDHLSGVKNGHGIGTTFAGAAMLVAKLISSVSEQHVQQLGLV